MSNSNLATYTRISPNRTSPRNHRIDTITIHCYVGQVTAKSGCNANRFTKYNPLTGASCNYVVGCDGSIGLCVEEKDRSWCSSNRANDHRAVTVEVACETTHPYRVTDAAMSALIALVTDICRRNDIERLVWSENKSDRVNHRNGCNMTVHRDYKNKACPGEYLYERHGYIAAEVNKRLRATPEAATEAPFVPTLPYVVKITATTLNVRKEATAKAKTVTTVKKNERYTIVEEKDGWGKLKSGAGWICLKYASKV